MHTHLCLLVPCRCRHPPAYLDSAMASSFHDVVFFFFFFFFGVCFYPHVELALIAHPRKAIPKSMKKHGETQGRVVWHLLCSQKRSFPFRFVCASLSAKPASRIRSDSCDGVRYRQYVPWSWRAPTHRATVPCMRNTETPFHSFWVRPRSPPLSPS